MAANPFEQVNVPPLPDTMPDTSMPVGNPAHPAEANPFASSDMQMVQDDSPNPFAAPDMIEAPKKPVQQSGAIMAGVRSAIPGLQEQLGEAESYGGRAARQAGYNQIADWLESHSKSNLDEVKAGQDASNTLPADAGLGSRAAYGIAQGIGQTAVVGGGGFAAGALAGGAAGAAFGGVGAIPGAIAGGLLGWTIANVGALPALMGFSQAGRTASAVADQKQKEGLSAEQANAQGLEAGAVTGTAAGAQGAVLGLLGPLGKVVGKAKAGSVVESALNATAGSIAKDTAKAAAVGAAGNVAVTAAAQGVEQQYGVGDGISGESLLESGLIGAGMTGLMHGPAQYARTSKLRSATGPLADPTASVEDRQRAAAAAVAAIATRDTQLAQDFGIYSAVQIAKGLPVDVTADHAYTAFAQDAKDKADRYAKAVAGQVTGEKQPGNGNSFVPGQGDRTFGAAPEDNSLRPTGADTSMQGQDINRPMPDNLDVRGIIEREAPPVAPTPIDPNDPQGTLNAIHESNVADDAFLDRALAAAHETGVLTPEAAEAPLSPEALRPEQQFYNDQRDQAGRDVAFQQAEQQQGTPPAVPDDAFAQRQAALAAEADRLRQQGHVAGVYDQAMNAPDRAAAEGQARADAYTAEQTARHQAAHEASVAQDTSETAARVAGEGAEQPTAMAQALQRAGVRPAEQGNAPARPAETPAEKAQLSRLGHRNPASLRTDELGRLVESHPDPAVRAAAQAVLGVRRNRAIAETPDSAVQHTGEMTGNQDFRRPGPVNDEAGIEFSRQRRESGAADGLETPRTPEGSAPVEAAPEIAPLKRALDADAVKAGEKSAGDFEHVTRDSLPEQRTAVENGVKGATTLSKSDYDLVTKQADLFNKKVVLFRQRNGRPGERLDGAVLPEDGNTIYLNADAAGAHHMVVVGHELAHQMEKDAPQVYKALKDALSSQTKGGLERFTQYYGESGNLKNPKFRSRMTHEFIADLVGNRAGELNTWRQVFASVDKGNRSMVYRLADYVSRFIGKLMNNEKFRKFATDDMVNSLNDTRTAVRRALADYASSQGMARMQHEAEQLRAAKANRGEEGPKLVEPVRSDRVVHDRLTDRLHDRASPEQVKPREPEPTQGTQRMEQSGTPRTERVRESGERDERTKQAGQQNEGTGAGRTAPGNGSGDEPTARPDGRLELTHWSGKAGLQDLDPAKHGTGLKGAELKRRDRDPDSYVNRTYFGLNVGEPGGYVKESGLGQHKYTTSVEPSKLYDIGADPAGLYPKGDIGPYADRLSMYEKAIRDAGYQGYWTAHPSMGKVAAVFDKLPVEHANERTTQTAEPALARSAERNEERAAVEQTAREPAALGRRDGGTEGEVPGYTRRSLGSDGNVTVNGRTVKGEQVSPTPERRAALQARGVSSPDYVQVSGKEGAQAFHDAILESKMQNPHGASVHVYTPEEYAEMRTFLTDDGKAGVAIKPDGDIVSVFNTPGSGIKGLTVSALDLAVQHGGTKLDAFDTVLPHLYAKSGFKAVARMHWNDEYSPEGWDKGQFEQHNGGEPDVVFMAHDPEGVADYQPGDGKLVTDYDEGVRLQDEAVQDAHPSEGEAGTANPLSSEPSVRRSGERANYLGPMDPAQEASARAVGMFAPKKTYKQVMQEASKDLGKKLQQGIADQFAPIRELDEKAYWLSRLSKGSDGALEAALLYGAPVIRDGVYDVDVHGKGFAKIMADLDGEHNRFLLWEAAHRAEDLKAEGRENLFTDQDISALKTLDQPDAMHPNRAQKFAQARREYRDFNEAMLKIARDSGILSDEDYRLFRDQAYVPFYRVMEGGDAAVPGGGKSAGLVNQYAFKKLKGGTSKLNEDLLVNVLGNYSHLLGAAARNRAAKATMDAAEAAGIAHQVPAAAAGKGSVAVRDGGKEVHYYIDDPHLLAAVSAMSRQVPGWMKPLSTFKRVLTHAVTTMPGFKVRNLIRDSISALAVGDLSPNIAKNLVEGAKGTSKKSQTYASMLASGGIIRMGSMLEGNEASRAHRLIEKGVPAHTILDRGMTDKLFGQARDLYHAYQELGDRSENINRAALYQQLIKQGKSHAEASFMARDMLDFSMQGNWPVIRFLTQSVPFMNARIQGLYKLGKAAASNPLRVGAVVGSVMMASLALQWAYQDDPDWKNREDWDRDNYWWFKIGGTAYRIPKPFEIGAAGTIAERTAELMMDKEMTGKRYMGRVVDILGQQFALNPTPQIVKPLVDVYANKDAFTGRPIENQAMQALQPEDRYDAHTSMTARFLGQLGLPDPVQLIQGRYQQLSPVQMESLLHGYFGSLGALALGVTDAIARPATGQASRPSMTLADLTGNAAETIGTKPSRYVSAMYDNLQHIEQAYNSYHTYLKTGQVDKARAELADNRNLIASYSMAEAAKRTMGKLSVQEKRIVNDESLSSAEKRDQLTALTKKKNALAQKIAQRELDVSQR